MTEICTMCDQHEPSLFYAVYLWYSLKEMVTCWYFTQLCESIPVYVCQHVRPV